MSPKIALAEFLIRQVIGLRMGQHAALLLVLLVQRQFLLPGSSALRADVGHQGEHGAACLSARRACRDRHGVGRRGARSRRRPWLSSSSAICRYVRVLRALHQHRGHRRATPGIAFGSRLLPAKKTSRAVTSGKRGIFRHHHGQAVGQLRLGDRRQLVGLGGSGDTGGLVRSTCLRDERQAAAINRAGCESFIICLLLSRCCSGCRGSSLLRRGLDHTAHRAASVQILLRDVLDLRRSHREQIAVKSCSIISGLPSSISYCPSSCARSSDLCSRVILLRPHHGSSHAAAPSHPRPLSRSGRSPPAPGPQSRWP